jgi:plasmid replication initiation protein
MENGLSTIQYNKELLIVQANKILRAKQDDLTLLEAKLIKLVVSQIAMSDNDLMTYHCYVMDLANFLEIPQDNIYRDMDSLSSSILTKRIYLIDENRPQKRNGQPNYLKFQWVSAFRYDNGLITIRLNDELKPWLLGLHAAFTEYGVECILKLPTSNSIRLLELLKSYEYTINVYSPRYRPSNLFPHIPRDNNELIFSLDYLKNYFNCADKYPATKDFIKRIIDASVRAINLNQENIRVSYRVAKEGRKIGYILFKINAFSDPDFKEFMAKTFGFTLPE